MSVKRNIIRNRIFSTVVGTFYSNISKKDKLSVFSNATVRKKHAHSIKSHVMFGNSGTFCRFNVFADTERER